MLLLAQAERRLGIAGRLASCIADPRDQGRVIHSLDGILRARILAIACGYEDAERYFLPIHVYDTATARPVAMLLRTGKTPSGAEVASHVRRLVRRIRRHWPTTRIMLRGDGHYGRPEPMAWCEANDVDYVFGLPGNTALHADPVIAAEGDACATDRALRELVELRRYAETRYAAKSWGTTKRRVVARIEASSLGLDIRFVVTSLKGGSPERIYDTLYCARGHAETVDTGRSGPAALRRLTGR